MKILLIGASGLVGRALLAKLSTEGHTILALCRHPLARLPQEQGVRWLSVDMVRLCSAIDWLPLLDGVDVVINCAGSYQKTLPNEYFVLNAEAPAALFAACAEMGVAKVIQLSALGATPNAVSAYWRSKAAGEAALMKTGLDWAIVRPSLVYADEANSSVLFCRMAACPWLFVPADAGVVQPIHLDDLTLLLMQLLESPSIGRRIIDAVGPHALAWADYLQIVRQSMGLSPAKVIRLPAGLLRWVVKLAHYSSGHLLSADSLLMLHHGSCAAGLDTTGQLARIAPSQFTHPALLAQAQLANWLPLARLVLAWLWLFTALVSYWEWHTGLALLADIGLPPKWQPAVLWAGIGLDAVMGLLTLLLPSRSLWLAQAGLVVGYTAIITVFLPIWWLHPFGPISKNLPVLLVLGLLLCTQPRRSAAP
ncbi:SDR family oxidoreductase [Chitinimonas sp. BJB300]|uniref:SDR family oxidoreductase n=1 Tax=Chitinimonas sp. BJB300 TaxID=1559339 RepID=UPI000C0EC069|nr:SDR family oxidoreductase [Chitinimonas sp. BJB300]PHV12004.1 NAD-dependent dehydratase [Chitinimonas sp. BJB300]TSJ91447.1 SDR family oxidoreductase [Chitinimonas sp. BJB300]